MTRVTRLHGISGGRSHKGDDVNKKRDDVTKSLNDIIERLKYITTELAATKSLVHTIMISLVTQKPTP